MIALAFCKTCGAPVFSDVAHVCPQFTTGPTATQRLPTALQQEAAHLRGPLAEQCGMDDKTPEPPGYLFDPTWQICPLCGAPYDSNRRHHCAPPALSPAPSDRVPHRCPVCEGRCAVPAGFYSGLNQLPTTVPEREPCRSCAGTGVIWSPS